MTGMGARRQDEFRLMVLEAVAYDPETGRLTWRKPTSNRCAAGDEVGHLHCNGYRCGRILGRREFVHRWVWFIVHGEWPDRELDHINGNRADNRIANLRRADRAGNAQNTARRSDNRSGFKGVHWHRGAGKWAAGIRTKGVSHHLGLFADLTEAASAYNSAALKYFGEFARLNDVGQRNAA